MPKRALLLLKDTSGVAPFARRLADDYGFELLASDAAGQALAAKGVPFHPVTEVAAKAMLEDRGEEVALLAANFVTVEAAGRAFLSWKSALASFDRIIVEAIRAAAWSADRIAVVGEPSDFDAALTDLQNHKGRFSQPFRMARSIAALRAASEFDFAVANYLEIQGAESPDLGALSGYPQAVRFLWPRAQALQSGENRHQQAALYGSFHDHFERAAGPALTYEAALTISRAAYFIGEFEMPCAALWRGGKLVAASAGRDLSPRALSLLARDEAAGSWLVANGSLGPATVEAALLAGIAGALVPDLSAEERERLEAKGRVSVWISKTGMGYEALQEVRSVAGGALVQDKDRTAINPMEWLTRGLVQPLVEDWEPMLFGARLARHLDSSACVLVKGAELLAMEAGGHSQLASWNALERRGIDGVGSVAVFDEPIRSVELPRRLKRLGARSALAPAGAEDEAVTQAANEAGLAFLTMPKSLRRL